MAAITSIALAVVAIAFGIALIFFGLLGYRNEKK